MADINFNCPHCDQNFDAPEEMAGETMDCPACEKPIVVPAPKPKARAAIPIRAPAPSTSLPKPGPDLTAFRQPEAISEEARKGTTVRIDLPKDAFVPRPKSRQVVIKRETRSCVPPPAPGVKIKNDGGFFGFFKRLFGG